jgi:hypothetical protein
MEEQESSVVAAGLKQILKLAENLLDEAYLLCLNGEDAKASSR